MRHVKFLAGLVLMVGLVGCAGSNGNERETHIGLRAVPASAQLVTSGGGSLSFHPPGPGRVYLYDSTADIVIWAGPVDKGQRFSVQPSGNRIWLGDGEAYHRDLDGSHNHRIYFERAAR